MSKPVLANTATSSPAVPSLVERLGTWFFAVVAIIIMPLLPLLVEAAKNDLEVKPENLLLTAAVLGIGFAFSSESNLFRASYGLIFFFSIGLNYHSGDQQINAVTAADPAVGAAPHHDSWLFGHPGYFVSAVCILHAVERMNWHVGKRKKFPDWLK